MENYKGIDYGRGQTNRDMETGIRFGVIQADRVPYWYEESEAQYGNPTCPKCGGVVVDYDDDEHNEYECEPNSCSDYTCEECEYVFDSQDAFPDEPYSFTYEKDGYLIEQSQDSPDLFILKSPFYTYAQFCSPCAPGAVYLETPISGKPEGNKGYCLGHNWFESGKAPYPVHRVKL